MSRRVWHFSFNYSYTVTLACVFVFCKQPTEIELHLPVPNHPFSKEAESLRNSQYFLFIQKQCTILISFFFSQTRKNACHRVKKKTKDFFRQRIFFVNFYLELIEIFSDLFIVNYSHKIILPLAL